MRYLEMYEVNGNIRRVIAVIPLEEESTLNESPAVDNVTINSTFTTYDVMRHLNCPCSLKGYTYITAAVELMNNSSRYSGVTTELYPELADRYGTTSTAVERSIRHAISIILRRASESILFTIFGYAPDRMTNSEFLSGLAAYISNHQNQIDMID